MHAHGIGQRELQKFRFLIVHSELTELHRDMVRLYGRDEADVAVKDLFLVIVLRLQHLVAEAKGTATVAELRFRRRRWIECRL